MGQTLLIIFNLFILEALLSLDNASVLAIMVKDLPTKDRSHALRYGIIGAFVLRGASLFFVAFLVKIIWLKLLGGAYLLYLFAGHFTPKNDTLEEPVSAKDSKIYKFASRLGISRLWSTIILIEIMDMAFSADNIFASVAITTNITLIFIGVFMGIIAMRFVAQYFAYLMAKFPSLETSAYVVIGLLGIKMIATGMVRVIPEYDTLNEIVGSRTFDLSFSGLMLLVFFMPLFRSRKKVSHAV